MVGPVNIVMLSTDGFGGFGGIAKCAAAALERKRRRWKCAGDLPHTRCGGCGPNAIVSIIQFLEYRRVSLTLEKLSKRCRLCGQSAFRTNIQARGFLDLCSASANAYCKQRRGGLRDDDQDMDKAARAISGARVQPSMEGSCRPASLAQNGHGRLRRALSEKSLGFGRVCFGNGIDS